MDFSFADENFLKNKIKPESNDEYLIMNVGKNVSFSSSEQ